MATINPLRIGGASHEYTRESAERSRGAGSSAPRLGLWTP